METQQPNPCVAQFSGKDAEGIPILSVLLKLTYEFDDSGRCRLAEEQIPLLRDVEMGETGFELLEDTDCYPLKLLSDVVVKGHVHAPDGAARLTPRVAVGAAEKSFSVLGDRRAALSRLGRVLFSDPLPFTQLPLTYRLAYGGHDRVGEELSGGNRVQQEFGNAVEPGEVDWTAASLFAYPRNLCGRGYLMNPAAVAVEALELPNFEDLLDPLTPDRLAVGSPAAWVRMPIPQGAGWLSWGWFPRSAYVGIFRTAETTTGPLLEEQRGWALPGLLSRPFRGEALRVFRGMQGASLGLSVPHLRGGETLVLEHLHPRVTDLRIQLPEDRPVLMTDGRKGKLNPTDPVIHHVVLSPDENRLTLVWRGCARALRPYFNEELETMPLLARWQG